MEKAERIRKVIFAVIDEVNLQLPEENRLKKSLKTTLFGEKSGLDSVGLITFIVMIEQKAENEFGVAISLTDERTMSREQSPFKDVGTLIEYISEIMEG